MLLVSQRIETEPWSDEHWYTTHIFKKWQTDKLIIIIILVEALPTFSFFGRRERDTFSLNEILFDIILRKLHKHVIW